MTSILLENIAEYGVSIVSIAAIIYVVQMFLNFFKHHIEYHTKAAQELTATIRELLVYLERTNGNRIEERPKFRGQQDEEIRPEY